MRALAILVSLHFLSAGAAQHSADRYARLTAPKLRATAAWVEPCRRRSSRNFFCAVWYENVVGEDGERWTLRENVSVTRTSGGVRVRSAMFD